MQSDIGTKLKTIRKKRGLTQQAVCMALNIDQPSLSYYENNLRIPQIDFLLAFAEKYQVSLDELFELDYAEKLRTLSPLERDIIDHFHGASEKDKKIVLTALEIAQ